MSVACVFFSYLSRRGRYFAISPPVFGVGIDAERKWVANSVPLSVRERVGEGKCSLSLNSRRERGVWVVGKRERKRDKEGEEGKGEGRTETERKSMWGEGEMQRGRERRAGKDFPWKTGEGENTPPSSHNAVDEKPSTLEVVYLFSVPLDDNFEQRVLSFPSNSFNSVMDIRPLIVVSV